MREVNRNEMKELLERGRSNRDAAFCHDDLISMIMPVMVTEYQ